MPKKPTQTELVFSYYKENPNRNIKNSETTNWAKKEWQRLTGEPFENPGRAIRLLCQQRKLIKEDKGIYRYDPDQARNVKLHNFTTEQKQAILKKDGYKCVMCGRGKEHGVELHVDHIKPRDKGGESTLENGQTLCGSCNYRKKNYNQTEFFKREFIKIYKQAKKENDTVIMAFCLDVLDVFDKHNIGSYIEWKPPPR